jgi:hypothetical protein
MKILLWNCCNGIGRQEQIDYFNSFGCDIAIVPEMKETNISAFSPCDSVWVTNNHKNPTPKGLGVLAFNGWKIKELPRDDEMEIFIPLRMSKNGFKFNLLAVWNFYYACKQGRYKGNYGLEEDAIKHYRPLFHDSVLICGDWNYGPTFATKEFKALGALMAKDEITSLYHKHENLPLDSTNHHTFKTTRKNFHHIDHMFGSKLFSDNITNYYIDSFENVVLSDHAPSLLELNLP